MSDRKAATKTKVLIEVEASGEKIPQPDIFDVSITSALNMPDRCEIKLTTSGAQKFGAKLKFTDELKVKLAHEGDDLDWAFIGEITGIDPVVSDSHEAGGTLVVRGLNSLHALSRGKRSYTFQKGDEGVTDKEIVEQVLRQPWNTHLKLSADFGNEPPKIKYKHVYQHNQTDLEFLRHRAARIGYVVSVRDKKLIFKKRDTAVSGLKLRQKQPELGDDKGVISLRSFHPRRSTAAQIVKVCVRSYQPDKRRTLKCVAEMGNNGPSKLAGETGSDAVKEKHGGAVLVRTDIPFSSKEEGDAIAQSLLNERVLNYVVGQGETWGDPRLKAGIVVEIDARQTVNDGKYYLRRVHHWYRHAGSDSNFTTSFEACRDAVESSGDA